MHIPRKPGEQIEVDWAGNPAYIVDTDTGEITDACIFVRVLTYSQCAYVEAFINEQTQAWITAHIHMYKFFGGVSRILISDNCTIVVDRKQSDWYTPDSIRPITRWRNTITRRSYLPASVYPGISLLQKGLWEIFPHGSLLH